MRKINGKKICVICEGFEELDYIGALKNKGVFCQIYDFITINAKSINTIFSRYQEKYQSDSYSLVLVFCDTDRGPSEEYKDIKRKINEFHGTDVADDIVIFGNPCTMQIILSHFGKVRLTSQSKRINASHIQRLTGIEGYKANEEQRKELFKKINRSNYEIMKENIGELSTNDEDASSTNILKFIKRFESADDSWIDEINNKL